MKNICRSLLNFEKITEGFEVAILVGVCQIILLKAPTIQLLNFYEFI